MQQVNLYQAQFYEQKPRLPATQMLATVVGVTVLCLFLTVFDYLQLADARDKTQVMQAKRNASEQRLNDYINKFPKSVLNHQLVKTKDEKRREAKAKLVLLKMLDKNVVGGGLGFSHYMNGLSEQLVRGLWLTSFEISDGGQHVSINGLVDKPEKVPEFLQKLGQSAAFDGKEFDVFKLGQDEDTSGVLRFNLSGSGMTGGPL